MTQPIHAYPTDLDDLDEWAYEVGNAPVQGLIRELKAMRRALAEIAQGEASGFELQQIAIRALAGDYNEV